jgi:hypothetical protein
MKRAAIFALLSVALFLPSSTSRAQEAPDSLGQQPEVLRVFVDCQTRCDFDHFRREIMFVNYVRDRRDADVHVLLTSQGTGGGGAEWTFSFIGLGDMAGMQDTLVYLSNTIQTEAEVRDGQTRTLALGLIRFAAGTPPASDIEIVYRPREQTAEQQAGPEDDPWKLWVFEVGAGGSINGETSRREFDVSGGIEASRTTEDWKIEFDAGGWYSRETAELSVGESVFISKSFDSEILVVRSLGDHWSTGVKSTVLSSTFGNLDFAMSAGPAIEYDIFRYNESTRRQLIFLYSVSVVAFNYEEITLFDQVSEVRVRQELEIAARARQPWGNVNASLVGGSYMHDLSLHRLTFGGGFNVRIFRGFNLGLNGSISRIKDQISIPREDIPDEDILLRRRQIGTDFRYRLRLNFSYEFGSVFNNVVNPRMNRF